MTSSTPTFFSISTPSTSAEVKRVHFTDLEDIAILNWLATGANADSYFKGNKTTACKEILAHLQAQKLSPRGVGRTWEAIRQRLATMLKKYHEDTRKKNQIGWGTKKHKRCSIELLSII